MHSNSILKSLVAGTACLALAACDLPGSGQPLPAPPPPAAPAPPTEKSAAAAAYFARVQQSLLSQGMLRTDPGTDIPITDRMLADTFMRTALFAEFTSGKSGIVRKETPRLLTRWTGPVRVSVRFGASIAPDDQAIERARIASYLGRLSGLIGLPVSIDEVNPNLWVYIVSEDEREGLEPAISALPFAVRSDVIETITRMPQSTYCNVFGLSNPRTHSFTEAVVVIRAENPDLLRLSCVHEEVAQAMGLLNDSPRSRPSIFNDDEEFALLTDQDELMLRMLYSPELRPGMSADEARPIVESLARRLTGGDS